MRMLFVSGTSVGGAARSTYELAALLAERGHVAATLVRDESAPRRTYLHRRAVNLRVKLGPRRAAPLVDRVARFIGARLTADPNRSDAQAYCAVRPENALAGAVRVVRPDVVIVNSIDLPAWRQIRDDLRDLAIPVVLYIREETGLLHLSHSKVPPDLVFANATGHAESACELGYDAVVVPSVIDCAACAVESSRERVVFVNPTAMHGLDIALALARARADIPFAFLESWPISDTDVAALQAELRALPNTELRRFVPDPRVVYADARVLLAPYRYPGRSRVIAEAQCNGIPTLASNRYGLAEAVGAGGILADPDGQLHAWLDGLATLWDDKDAYAALSAAALEHSKRPEMQRATIAATVEKALGDLVVAYARSDSGRRP
jgi:glycosyltransferase involved in cell wall biosynthesis